MKKLVGYKKVRVRNKKTNNSETYILELEIPADAGRTFPSGPDDKGRAQFARVRKAWRVQGQSLRLVRGKRTFRHIGFYDASSITYVVGKIVRPNGYDNSDAACGKGINFFLSKTRAKRYN